MRRRSYGRASAWLAAFVIGVPGLGLVVVTVAVPELSPQNFAVLYLILMAFAYLVGLVLLAVLRFSPDWMRALVTAVALYVIALLNPLTQAMASYPIHVVRCGGLPILATNFAAAKSYSVPGRVNYSVSPLNDRAFCTEEAAKAAGYSRSNF